MDGITRNLLSALICNLLFCSSAPTASPLPSDPTQWTCADPQPTPQEIEQWCAENEGKGQPADLGAPGPGSLLNLDKKNAYDLALRRFYENRDYAQKLKWAHDQQWRLTGPLVGQLPDGKTSVQYESYGVHPVVRIYYSPEMVDWLCHGRQGPIKDGAMIIKEMLSIDSVKITADAKQCMAIDQASAEQSLQKGNLSWAVMVKANHVSSDGWYWSSPNKSPLGNPPLLDQSAVTDTDFFGSGKPIKRNPNWYPTGDLFQPLSDGAKKKADVVYPYNMYGAYCLNCHAAAQRESTYSSLDNILTTGLQYKFFPSDSPKSMLLTFSRTFHTGHADLGALFLQLEKSAKPKNSLLQAPSGYHNPFSSPLPAPRPAFLAFYNMLPPLDFSAALQLRFPAETYDHYMSGPNGPGQFVTSDQCIGCHDATQNNSATPNMLITDMNNLLLTVPAASSVNFSPYGEWRVSPMGLAGRDPIFFAQLQSETNTLPELSACIQNTCLHCHGVMGQRQYSLDNPDPSAPCRDLFAVPPPPEVPFGKPFARRVINQWQGAEPKAEARYGALARDGISCTVCHHITDEKLGQETSFTGNFATGPGDKVFGPYADNTIVTDPMKHALGITPQFGKQIANSDMCGSCHNILLPVFNNDGTRHSFMVNRQTIQSTYEQTTHLEWVNSDFAKEGADFQSCQDCHMQRHYPGKNGQQTPLTSIKIANSEDNTFPPTTHSLASKDITLTPRQTFGRHALHGVNLFLNAMFQQFPLLLGLRQLDYMVTSSAQPALITGQNSMLQMARQETAAVKITGLERNQKSLKATVLVTNKAGHYLPSGVGFRRAFLEVIVEDKDGKPLWASGRTNELGVIVEGLTNTPLPAENFSQNPRLYLPHYQQITRSDQAQIYQEVILDSAQDVTTSFLRRVQTVKDNRIRPKGYDPQMFAHNPSPYIQELAEAHGVEDDPYYRDPTLTGADTITYLIALPSEQLAQVSKVRITLYNQSIPPSYLQQRFMDATKGQAEKDDIQRLYYLTSHLNPTSAIANWKLALASAEQTL
ncbi:MAG: hypothetical protein AB7P69_12145 [Candidatus Binatia bacterium]